jgi:predicted nuclease of predicted toxin-antitoxin system
MQFLADMGVSSRVVDWLRSQGHDVAHLRERGLQRLPNGDIFVLAAQEQRILLTFDLDFGEIVAHSPTTTVSVLIFRLKNTRTSHVIKRLNAVLEESSTQLSQGAVVVVEEARHRIRKLPIGK